MRRLSRLVSSLAVLAAITWCVLWIYGREALGAWLDTELDRLRAAGHQIDLGRTSIAGFPFAFATHFEDVTFVDASGGVRTQVSELVSRVDISAPRELVTELPPRLEVSFDVPPALAAAYPWLGERLALEIVSDGLVIMAAADAPEGGGRIRLRARHLQIRPAGQAQPSGRFTLAARAIETDLSGALDGIGPVSASISTEAFELELSRRAGRAVDDADGAGTEAGIQAGTEAGAGTETWQLSLSDLQGQADLVSDGGPALTALLNVGGGNAEIALEASQLDAALTVAGTGGGDGRIAAATGRVTTHLSLAPTETRADTDAVTARLALEPADASDPRRGQLEIASLTVRSRNPVAPSAEMQPLRLALRADGLQPAPDLWRRLDPEGALPRHPGALAIELDGTARIPAAGATEGETPSDGLVLGQLELERLAADALGARAEAEGLLAFDQPGNRPVGEIAVRLSGVLDLLTRLRRAGLIDERQLQVLATAAAVYTRGGNGPDELLVDLVFDQAGIRLNQERVGFGLSQP
ncbi:MAG: DUF2125 domain-containing protein [Pikeienuella sp.]